MYLTIRRAIHGQKYTYSETIAHYTIAHSTNHRRNIMQPLVETKM